MKLLVTVRLSSPDARTTRYVPVEVEANDGGVAQQLALQIASAAHPNMSVSGGTVYPSEPVMEAKLEEEFGEKTLRDESKKRGRPRLSPQVGVKTVTREPVKDEKADDN